MLKNIVEAKTPAAYTGSLAFLDNVIQTHLLQQSVQRQIVWVALGMDDTGRHFKRHYRLHSAIMDYILQYGDARRDTELLDFAIRAATDAIELSARIGGPHSFSRGVELQAELDRLKEKKLSSSRGRGVLPPRPESPILVGQEWIDLTGGEGKEAAAGAGAGAPSVASYYGRGREEEEEEEAAEEKEAEAVMDRLLLEMSQSQPQQSSRVVPPELVMTQAYAPHPIEGTLIPFSPREEEFLGGQPQ
jgi:hypothetical protein